jgi:HAD superfamily hydrolase (TIGR01484 family)
MRYHALATDYDGTIAHHGFVEESTIEALRRIKESGRKLILVTGRELPELLSVFPAIDTFDQVVAENGALLYTPATKAERPLAQPPPPGFVEALRRRNVRDLSVGRVIVATWEPHHHSALDVIREQGLELQVIFNKGAVMILPSGVNKATGLIEACKELAISTHNVVGVGDAENDHAFLSQCECGVAVANALETLKDRADWVTTGERGAGVVEVIERLQADDLSSLDPRLTRHHIGLGLNEQGREVRIPVSRCNVLVAGTSGGGKSTLTTGLMERLVEAKYQIAILDPEGDYDGLEFATAIGDRQNAPSVERVIDLLDKPEAPSASVNLLALSLIERPAFADALLPRLHQLRTTLGRPHWIVIDEAHHLLPAAWTPSGSAHPAEQVSGLLLITVHPESVSRIILEQIHILLAIGQDPAETIRKFAQAAGRPAPEVGSIALESGETLAWWINGRRQPFRVRSTPPNSQLRRHSKKYAEGNLGPDRSFYFRGPERKLNLRAQNLLIFTQLAEGVDDPTWLFHLERGDYARWFREQVKDDSLAEEAETVTAEAGLSAAQSRQRIIDAITSRYTLPAEPAGWVTDQSKFG